MKSKFEIFLDTDVFTEVLSGNNDGALSRCTGIFDGCYTSVINASEVFSECSTTKRLNKAKDLFKDVGILGIPFRYSLKIGEVMKAIKKKKSGNSFRDAMVIAMCSETRLPLFTSNEIRYRHISKIFKVKLINKETILNYNSPESIFQKAKIL